VRDVAAAAGALGVDRHHSPVAKHPHGLLDRERVDADALDRDLPQPAEQRPAEPVEHLALHQRVHRPGREDGQQRTDEQPDVVARQQHRPLGGHVLRAVHAHVVPASQQLRPGGPQGAQRLLRRRGDVAGPW
jgi:hypothetical protein